MKGQASFTLNEDEVFYGVGIHGEKGYRKEALSSSEILAIELMNKLKAFIAGEKVTTSPSSLMDSAPLH